MIINLRAIKNLSVQQCFVAILAPRSFRTQTSGS